MASEVAVRRRYGIGQLRDKKSVEIDLGNLSESQKKMKDNLKRLLSSIFVAFKRNQFKNDKNINLLSSYFLLKNIADSNGQFIKLFKSNRESAMSAISDLINEITSVDSLGNLIFNDLREEIVKLVSGSEQSQKIKDGVLEIFGNVVQDYARENKSDEHEKPEESPEANIERLKEALENDAVKKAAERVKSSVKKFDQKYAKYNNLYLNALKINKVATSDVFKRVLKNKDVQEQLEKLKNSSKIVRGFSDFSSKASKIYRNVRFFKLHVLKNIVGLRKKVSEFQAVWKSKSLLGKIGMAGTLALTSAFGVASIVFGTLFKATSFVAGKIIGGIKGITGFVVENVGAAVKFLTKPLIPMLTLFMLTPQGQFFLGVLYAALEKKFTQYFAKDSKGMQRLSEIKLALAGIVEKIRRSVKHLNLGKLGRIFKKVANSGVVKDILEYVVEAFSPENLKVAVGSWAAGKVLGWGAGFIPRAAIFNPATMLATASVAAFVTMGRELSETIENVKGTQEYNKIGGQYERSALKLSEKKNPFRLGNLPNLLTVNEKSLIRKMSEVGEIQDQGIKDILDSFREAGDRRKKEKEYDSLMRIVDRESKIIQNERDSIVNSLDNETKKKIFSKQTYVNGKTEYAIDVSNPTETRMRAVLLRLRLLSFLKGNLINENEYNDAVKNLIRTENGVGIVGDNLGDKIRKLLEERGGFKFYKKGKYKEFGEGYESSGVFADEKHTTGYAPEINTGTIDFKNLEQVSEALNFTAEQIVREQSAPETDNLQFKTDTNKYFSLTAQEQMEIQQILVNLYFGKKTTVNRGRVAVSDLSKALELMYQADRTKRIVKKRGNGKYRELNKETETAIKDLLNATLFGSRVREKIRELFLGSVSGLFLACLDPNQKTSGNFDVCVINPKSKKWSVAMTKQQFDKYYPTYCQTVQKCHTWEQLDEKTAADGVRNFVICESKVKENDSPPFGVYSYNEKYQEQFLDNIAEKFYDLYLRGFIEVFDSEKQTIETNIQTKRGIGSYSPDQKIQGTFGDIVKKINQWSIDLMAETKELFTPDGKKSLQDQKKELLDGITEFVEVIRDSNRKDGVFIDQQAKAVGERLGIAPEKLLENNPSGENSENNVLIQYGDSSGEEAARRAAKNREETPRK